MKGNRGMTLVELVVAVSISGLISTTALAAIGHLTIVKGKDSKHIEAVRELERSVYYIGRDIRMAQATDLVQGVPSPQVTLSWVERWAGGEVAHTSFYRLWGQDLLRTYDGTPRAVARGIARVQFSLEGRAIRVTVEADSQGLGRTYSRSLALPLRSTP